MKKCSKCKIRPRKNQGKSRYCLECHSAYMKEWRKTHPLSEKQYQKEKARAYAREYLKRGKIQKKHCERCDSWQSQMHHPDYSKPLKVVWLCCKHHLEEHSIRKG